LCFHCGKTEQKNTIVERYVLSRQWQIMVPQTLSGTLKPMQAVPPLPADSSASTKAVHFSFSATVGNPIYLHNKKQAAAFTP
jgi:hypothetical protein